MRTELCVLTRATLSPPASDFGMKNPSHYMLRDLEKAINADVRKKSEKNGGSPPWLKDFAGQLYDPEYTSLSLADRGLLKDLRLIALPRKNKIPNDEAYLRAQLRCNSRTRIAQRLHNLCTAGFLLVHPDAVEMPLIEPKTPTTTLEPLASEVSLEERREEKTVRRDVVEDVAGLDLDELESAGTVDELAVRRGSRAEVNGSPLGPILDELLKRGETG